MVAGVPCQSELNNCTRKLVAITSLSSEYIMCRRVINVCHDSRILLSHVFVTESSNSYPAFQAAVRVAFILTRDLLQHNNGSTHFTMRMGP